MKDAEKTQEPVPLYNQSQTQFAVEEPFFEKPPQEPIDPASIPPEKPKTLYLILGAGAFIVVILILAVINRPQPVEDTEVKITPTPTLQPELNPIQQKLQTAIEKLEQANPTTETLPFPPVNMELRIDDPER